MRKVTLFRPAVGGGPIRVRESKMDRIEARRNDSKTADLHGLCLLHLQDIIASADRMYRKLAAGRAAVPRLEESLYWSTIQVLRAEDVLAKTPQLEGARK